MALINDKGGAIPGDWEIKRLGEIADFLDGRRKPIKDADRAKMKGNIPYYGASGIIDYVNDFIFNEDLILLGEDGENIVSRNCRLAFKVSGKTWVNNHAHVLKPKAGYDINYLTEKLESINYEQYNTGTAQPKLNQKVCYNIPVAIPPTKAEQTAIATALSDTDALITSLEKLIAKKRNIKQGAMQTLLRPKENWTDRKIQDIAKVGRGRVISHSEIAKSTGKTYPVYSSQTTNKGIMGYIDSFDFDGEYVTWTTDGEKAGTVFYRNGKFNCTNVCGTLKVITQHCPFIALAFQAVASKYVSRNLANPKLMNEVVKNIVLKMPPLEEQRQISDTIWAMQKEINAHDGLLQKVTRVKTAMMQTLLTGKIRIV